MKAIQTFYKGFHFRSRLEARWAVFFDALGVKWEYEIEGFELDDGRRYLPDFWLPDLRTWVEVKGELTYEPFETLPAFSVQAGCPVLMFVGAPWEVRVLSFDASLGEGQHIPGFLFAMNRQLILLNGSIETGQHKSRNEYPNEIILVDEDGLRYFEFLGCDPDEAKQITGRIYDSEADFDESYVAFDSAIAASKRARFEFGETPR